jgi:uncharacterized protein YutE (UPF0331/DUF86 family)
VSGRSASSGGPDPDPSSSGGLTKGQRRIVALLQEIPATREQLLVAMEEFGPSFASKAFLAAARSRDPRERNRVAAVERGYEVLINWLHELAARGLAEAQRLGVVNRSPDPPWERLAELGAISRTSAERLQVAKEMRDALAHAYPPANWKGLHEGIVALVDELDRYLDGFKRWVYAEEVLPLPAERG